MHYLSVRSAHLTQRRIASAPASTLTQLYTGNDASSVTRQSQIASDVWAPAAYAEASDIM